MLQKTPLKIWDINIVIVIFISKLINTKTNSKYLVGYLDKFIRPLVFIMLKMSGYVKILKVRDVEKDKSNKLMSFRIDD